jgi:ATP-dependent Clp protease protease subunit
MTQAPEHTAGPLDDQLTVRLQHQRIIVLGQEVDDPIANRICAQLLLLSAEDPHRDISLYINSPGGSVTAGMAIYDTMQLIPNDVSTLAMGMAASMGQFLLTAGAPGKRFVLPNTEVLLHQGSAGLGGSASDIEIQAARLARLNERMLQITAERTGQPVERIREDSLRDKWFTAPEARDYGFVDAVLSDVRAVTPAHHATVGLAAGREPVTAR